MNTLVVFKVSLAVLFLAFAGGLAGGMGLQENYYKLSLKAQWVKAFKDEQFYLIIVLSSCGFWILGSIGE